MNNFGGGFSPNQVVGGWVEVDDENVSCIALEILICWWQAFSKSVQTSEKGVNASFVQVVYRNLRNS